MTLKKDAWYQKADCLRYRTHFLDYAIKDVFDNIISVDSKPRVISFNHLGISIFFLPHDVFCHCFLLAIHFGGVTS